METPRHEELRNRVATLSIYVNESRRIDKSQPERAGFKNFLPRPNKQTNRLEKSTLCLQEVDEELAWNLLQHASPVREVLGRADLDVADILLTGLELDIDWTPERHVNLIAWPADAPEAEADRTTIAQSLHKAHRWVRR